MAKRVEVEKSTKGFLIKPSKERVEKLAREDRIKDRKLNAKSNPTNREIMEYLNDTNDRISEIYNVLKGR